MLSSLVNRYKVSPFATKSLIHGNKHFSLFSVNIFRSLFRYISVYSYIGNNVVWLQLRQQSSRKHRLHKAWRLFASAALALLAVLYVINTELPNPKRHFGSDALVSNIPI